MSARSAARRRLETVYGGDNGTHMHHFRIALPIVSVEEVEHILLKLFTVPVDVFSCLLRYLVTGPYFGEV